MRTLILMRHGEADEAATDHARPLTDRGRAQCLRSAGELRARGLSPARVLASSAVRALQSAELVAEALGAGRAPESDPALYLAEPSQYLEALRTSPRQADCVLLVAHNPGLSVLAAMLRNQHTALPTAGYVVIELSISDWSRLGV